MHFEGSCILESSHAKFGCCFYYNDSDSGKAEWLLFTIGCVQLACFQGSTSKVLLMDCIKKSWWKKVQLGHFGASPPESSNVGLVFRTSVWIEELFPCALCLLRNEMGGDVLGFASVSCTICSFRRTCT